MLAVILLTMQAVSLTKESMGYNGPMQTGRPSDKQRPPFGERLHALREQAGLSQQQVAERLGLSQRAYAYWERNSVSLRPEQILKLAETLGVGVEDLLVVPVTKSRKGSGRLGRVFDEAAKLPRRQQQKIIDIVEPFIREQTAP